MHDQKTFKQLLYLSLDHSDPGRDEEKVEGRKNEFEPKENKRKGD